MNSLVKEIEVIYKRGDQRSRMTSRVGGVAFEHELSCLVQERPDLYRDCNCYISRIRLVPTPLGDWLPTTDPDLAPELVFWEARAKHWERQAWIARGLFLALGIAGAVIGSL